MRIVYIVAMLGLLIGQAYAKDGHTPEYGEPDPEKTNAQKAAEKADARAYSRSLTNIPDKGPVDPWGTVRNTDAPKAAAKPEAKTSAAKPKSKPAATTN